MAIFAHVSWSTESNRRCCYFMRLKNWNWLCHNAMQMARRWRLNRICLECRLECIQKWINKRHQRVQCALCAAHAYTRFCHLNVYRASERTYNGESRMVLISISTVYTLSSVCTLDRTPLTLVKPMHIAHTYTHRMAYGLWCGLRSADYGDGLMVIIMCSLFTLLATKISCFALRSALINGAPFIHSVHVNIHQ